MIWGNTDSHQKAELKGQSQYTTSKVNTKRNGVYRTEGKPHLRSILVCTHLEENSLACELSWRKDHPGTVWGCCGAVSVVLSDPCSLLLGHTGRPHFLAHLLPGEVMWLGLASKMWPKWQVWLLGQSGVPLNFLSLHLRAKRTIWLGLEEGGATRWQEPMSLNGCTEQRSCSWLTSGTLPT